MFQQMKKRIKNEKGLTLIELLAVIVILAIVAAIAIPAIGNIINNSREKSVLADVSAVLSAAKIANVDGDCGTDKKCSATELASYITVPGFKGTNDVVDFSTAPSDPTIQYTLTAAEEEIKADGKIGIEIKKYDTDFAGTVIGIKESDLNKVLDK